MIGRWNALKWSCNEKCDHAELCEYMRGFIQISLQKHVWCVKNLLSRCNFGPLRKLFAPTSVPSWLRACSRYVIIKLWIEEGGRNFVLFLTKNVILCYTYFSEYHCVYVSFWACYCGLSICAYPCIAENINPRLVYIFSDTKIIRR